MPMDSLVGGMLADLASSEARLVASAAVLVICLAAYLLAPLLVKRLVRLNRHEFVKRHAGSAIETLEEAIDWPFPTTAVIRLLQLAVTLLAGLLLLVVWGHADTAIFLVDVLLLGLPILIRLLATLGLVALGIVGTRLLEDWITSYTDDVDHINEHQEGVAFRVLQVTVFIAIGLAALSLWDVDLGGLLIGAGFLGIVVGMAARQTLGSMIAGFVLMFSRPFEIGDWIQIGDREGIVTDITIINTRLRNFDDETIVLPNDSVSNSTVVNMTESQRLRVRLNVGIAYGTDVEHAESVALDAMEDLDEILSIPKPSVFPRSFGDSAITLELRFWIEHPSAARRTRAQAAVLRSVKAAFDGEGIGIPFPQRELSGQIEERITEPESRIDEPPEPHEP